MNTTFPVALQDHPEWVDLYQRLHAFQVSTYEDVPLAFLGKLARMNGWTVAYTERVFTEYKRFLFLTMTAGHFVCPCEAVDQTWHFHLIYTESYWQDLCGTVLGKPLHHIPSRGGLDERNAFYRDYAETLASYEHWFGEKPPADIWESPGERLRDTPYLRLVNTRTHGVIKRLINKGSVHHGWVRKGLWLGTLGLAGFIGVTQAGDMPTLEDVEVAAIWLMPWLIPLIIVLWSLYGVVKAVWNDPWGCLLPLAGFGAFFISFFFLGGWSWIVLLIGVIAYAAWSNQRCPQCKTRHVFKPTGVQNKDAQEAEHQCSSCGYTAWISTRSSNGGGGGGDADGGCGGSGGSGGSGGG